MVNPADILVVVPHPDDAESRVAGTVARWTREGKEVVYVVATNGNKGTGQRDIEPDELVRIREKEQLAAAEVLGVREVVFLGHPDQELEDTPVFRKEIIRAMRTYRPEILVSLDPYQRYLSHRDHRVTALTTWEAIHRAGDVLAYPDLLAGGLAPHRIREVWLTGFERLNHRFDITDTFDIKVAALRCHQSQVGDRPELTDWMKQRAQHLAEGCDFELAEAYNRIEVDWSPLADFTPRPVSG